MPKVSGLDINDECYSAYQDGRAVVLINPSRLISSCFKDDDGSIIWRHDIYEWRFSTGFNIQYKYCDDVDVTFLIHDNTFECDMFKLKFNIASRLDVV